MPVSPTLRAKILAQAQYRCGYCLTQQIVVNWLLEVEHIIPTVAGGSDDEENLWLSGTACNRYKGRQIQARDGRTGRLVRLFNPRRQLSHLLWKNQDGTITAQEEAELDTLVAEGQQGTLRKAKALLALKHLGIDMLPALQARVRSSSR